MALLISFDSATRHCAVALSENGRVLASRMDAGEKASHAERLNVLIDEVMREAGRSLNELDAVACGIGPGSYTGLRIGLSAAKGLCFALGKPLIAMSTLDVLVHQWMAEGGVLDPADRAHPMVDARRMEVFTRTYTAPFHANGPATPLIITDAWFEALPEAGRHIVLGDGADKAAEFWVRHPRARHVAGVRPSVEGTVRCASDLFARGIFADLAYTVPDYGKAANVGAAPR